jgi:hypothetical protein
MLIIATSSVIAMHEDDFTVLNGCRSGFYRSKKRVAGRIWRRLALASPASSDMSGTGNR